MGKGLISRLKKKDRGSDENLEAAKAKETDKILENEEPVHKKEEEVAQSCKVLLLLVIWWRVFVVFVCIKLLGNVVRVYPRIIQGLTFLSA